MSDDRPPLLEDRSFLGLLPTQLLGAFNDNVFKQTVLLVAVAYAGRVGDAWWPQPVATAAFSIPFLFSCWTGVLADRVSKRSIVVGSKALEVGVMLAGTAVFLTTDAESAVRYWALVAVLFVMAGQSTLFGPAKYGVLPELFREGDLPRANGLIQMTTFAAIIFGLGLAGVLKESLAGRLWVVGLACVGIAGVGTATSLLVRKTSPADPDAGLSWRRVWPTPEVAHALLDGRTLRRALLVYSIFWMLGTVLSAAVNDYGLNQLGLSETETSLLAAALGLGIGGGCAAAAWLSREPADFRLVLIGSLGVFVLGIAAAVLPWVLPGGVAVVAWTSGAVLALLGMFAGLLAVPLQVFIQAAPPAAIKGRAIGLMNTFNAVGMVLGSALYGLIVMKAGTDRASVAFAVVGVLMAPAAVLFRAERKEQAAKR